MDTGEASDDASNASDDSLLTWQNVTTKRKKTKKTKNSDVSQKRKKITEVPVASTSKGNKFMALAMEEDENDEDADTIEAEVPPKPPPIFFSSVSDINKMVKNVSNIISNDEFNYKCMRDGQVKINVKSINSFRTLIKYLDVKQFSYHTFQVKSDRSYRFVIKGLHPSTPVEDIKAELLLKGHQVRYVVNVKSRFNKEPLPMFYVDLDPNPDNKNVFDIKYMNNCVVQIEAPRTSSDIVQCHRCQIYGHTKTYCRRPFVCVKCGLGHQSANCPKERETPPKCIHCLKTHTANYKGCQVYQKLVQKLNPAKKHNPSSFNHFTLNTNEFPNLKPGYVNNDTFQNTLPNQSYANVANHNNQTEENNILMKNIEKLIQKQIELTNSLMNMMTLVLNKLCK